MSDSESAMNAVAPPAEASSHTPRQRLGRALEELALARVSFAKRNARQGAVLCKRAAGLALNGALVYFPKETWGRSFVQHLEALRSDEDAPLVVREAATRLHAVATDPKVVILATNTWVTQCMEDTQNIMAHAYTLIARGESSKPSH